MAANENVMPAVALLVVLLPLTMLSSMALAARHPPVGESHLSLIPPFFRGPVAKTPPRPPATASAEDDDDSPLREVPRGPNHSPNEPSPPLATASAEEEDDDSPLRKVARGPNPSPNDPPPPPASAVAAAKLPLLVGEEVASSRPIEPLDGPRPTVEH